MSYKPCRGGGVMLDKFKRNAERWEREFNNKAETSNPPKFNDINYLSKCVYLYWLNDVKFSEQLGGTKNNRPGIEYYCTPYFLRIFKANKNLIYKPLLKIIN